VFNRSAIWIYEAIHGALRDALVEGGIAAVGAAVADRRRTGALIKAGVSDPGYNCGDGYCFANPVYADVLVNGSKVAGAAQRRTRWGLLHQGSIQGVDVPPDLQERFSINLGKTWIEAPLTTSLKVRAHEIADQKYGTEAWLRRR
jgi:lipoate-protein ligase A